MRTAAWSVPVIAVAAATPMAAASETLENVNVGYVNTVSPTLHVFGTISSYVAPRPEHFVVNGTPQVHVTNAWDQSVSSFHVQLRLDGPLTTVSAYTLTISLPGFTPVTAPIIAV